MTFENIEMDLTCRLTDGLEDHQMRVVVPATISQNLCPLSRLWSLDSTACQVWGQDPKKDAEEDPNEDPEEDLDGDLEGGQGNSYENGIGLDDLDSTDGLQVDTTSAGSLGQTVYLLGLTVMFMTILSVFFLPTLFIVFFTFMSMVCKSQSVVKMHFLQSVLRQTCSLFALYIIDEICFMLTY